MRKFSALIFTVILLLDFSGALFLMPEVAYADITTNLVGHWKFDEGTGVTTADSSGFGNTGDLLGSPAWTTGRLSGALDFDADDSFVQLTTLVAAGTGTTIAAWIYPRSTGENGFGMIAAQNGGYALSMCSNDGTECPSTPNTLELYSYHSGTDGIWHAASNAITMNQWNHVVVTYDNSSTSNEPIFYVNGAVSATTERVEPTSSAPANKIGFLGGLDASGGFVFDGIIDDVRIYSRVLTGSDVTELYATGAGATRIIRLRGRVQIWGGARLR